MTRSIAGAALSGKTLGTAGVLVYQAAFDAVNWSGDVTASWIGMSASGTAYVTAAPAWSAAQRLGELAAPARSRNIVAGSGAAAPDGPVATTFTWPDIGPGLKASLDRLRGGPPDGLGEARLDFLRGDRAQEGLAFRRRHQLLGDIVNSGVVYVGPPKAVPGLGPAYSAFREAVSRRPAVVYAGANDGMLHAFDAASGDELFAYIPGWLGGKLSALTDPAHGTRHMAYVDATAYAAQAQVAAAGLPEDWRTVLVSGTGAGGPGVFALDVSDPEKFSPSGVLWEFSRADDADMGYVAGPPQIVRARTSEPGAPPVYRWFAMVAGGVNSHVGDAAFGGAASATGQPALFMLALDKPPGTRWTSDGPAPNYYKITLPVDAGLARKAAPGLVNFTATLGRQFELDRGYMGDLHGQLWRLDFSRVGASGWTLALLSGRSAGGSPRPVFVAAGAQGVQPVSMAPTVLNAAGAGRAGALQIAFATGRFMDAGDRTSTAVQSVYVLYDDVASGGHAHGEAGPIGRQRLQKGSVNTATFEISTPPFVWGNPASDEDLTQRAGWYADLPWPGERAIHAGVSAGSLWAFDTLIPASQGLRACDGGFTYHVRYRTGSGASSRSLFGVPLELKTLALPSHGAGSQATGTGRRKKAIPMSAWSGGAGGSLQGRAVPAETFAGRLNWRHVSNYRELKNKP